MGDEGRDMYIVYTSLYACVCVHNVCVCVHNVCVCVHNVCACVHTMCVYMYAMCVYKCVCCYMHGEVYLSGCLGLVRRGLRTE